MTELLALSVTVPPVAVSVMLLSSLLDEAIIVAVVFEIEIAPPALDAVNEPVVIMPAPVVTSELALKEIEVAAVIGEVSVMLPPLEIRLTLGALICDKPVSSIFPESVI